MSSKNRVPRIEVKLLRSKKWGQKSNMISNKWVTIFQFIKKKWSFFACWCTIISFPGGPMVKSLPVKQETRVWPLGRKGPLEDRPTLSGIPAWRIARTGSLTDYSSWGRKETRLSDRVHMHACKSKQVSACISKLAFFYIFLPPFNANVLIYSHHPSERLLLHWSRTDRLLHPGTVAFGLADSLLWAMLLFIRWFLPASQALPSIASTLVVVTTRNVQGEGQTTPPASENHILCSILTTHGLLPSLAIIDSHWGLHKPQWTCLELNVKRITTCFLVVCCDLT